MLQVGEKQTPIGAGGEFAHGWLRLVLLTQIYLEETPVCAGAFFHIRDIPQLGAHFNGGFKATAFLHFGTGGF